MKKKRDERIDEQRWGKLFSFRIPKEVDEVLNPEPHTRSSLCESFLEDANGSCPVCDQEWPRQITALERVGVRLNDPVYSKIQPYPSTYVRAWILVGLGFCPLCHQRWMKK